jgi:hypothetical protein
VFLWRYAAGAVATIVAYVLVKSVRSSWRVPTRTNVSIMLFLLMMVVGGPTHAIVKIRPMKTIPVLGYHTMLGTMAAALLIAFGVMYVANVSSSRFRTVVFTAGVWFVIVYGALTRPAMLSHLAAQGGLGEGLYPDPWRALEFRLGIPISRPAGDEPYVLQRVQPSGYGSQRVEARSSDWFIAMNHRMAPASEWQLVAGQIVPLADGRWRVHGDGTLGRLQLVSPRLDVPPHRTIGIRIDVTREQGHVCIGIYDRAGDKWISTPELLAQEYEFDSGSAADVRVAVANCDVRLSENADSIFQVGSGSYDAK